MTRAEGIADILRARIVDGRLRPGDAVPSTRAIMRDHNVAMATASKVLSLLQGDDLIESTPGRGSVVRARDDAGRPVLTREGVVAAAVGIADAEGLAAVSMRRLASALEIPTMAVYRYVPSREQLEIAMLDRVMADVPLPPESGEWRTDLHGACVAMWRAMTAHPWFAGALSMTRPASMPNAMPLADRMMGSLHAAGVEPRQAFTDYLGLVTLVRGFGETLEPELADRAETGLTNDEWMDTRVAELRALAPAARYPNMARIMDLGYPYDVEVLLESGLRTFIDGIEARLV